MLSKKEDFDRFMADDDISAYVAILKATIKDKNKIKADIEKAKKEKIDFIIEIAPINELLEYISTHEATDDFFRICKIDKNRFRAIFKLYEFIQKKRTKSKKGQTTIIKNITLFIFYKLNEMGYSQKQSILFVFDKLFESNYYECKEFNVIDFKNYLSVPECDCLRQWRRTALIKIMRI